MNEDGEVLFLANNEKKKKEFCGKKNLTTNAKNTNHADNKEQYTKIMKHKNLSCYYENYFSA